MTSIQQPELPEDLILELRDQLNPLAMPLYEGLAHSLAFANQHNRRFSFSEQPHLWSLTARAELREHYKENPLPSGWAVGGDPRLMGQLLLLNEDLGLEITFLKENRRVHPDALPPAGQSRSRRARWTSPALFELEGTFTRADRIVLHQAWDYGRADDGSVDLDTFSTRIVHTTEAGVFGRSVGCNFFYNILPSGELLTTQRFDGDAAEEDFFIKRDVNDQQ